MSNDLNYKTFLFCSNKKFVLSVVQSKNSKTIYEKKKFFSKDINSIEFNDLEEFLENNVYEIEKKIDRFIKDIYLILDINDFFPIRISIKKNINENPLSFLSLAHPLSEAKELCFKNSNEEKIIHMIIDNYRIDDKNYYNFPKNIKCNNFSLDLSFICLPNFLIKKLEKVLKNYQISINRILNNNYIESLFSNNEKNLLQKALMVIEGLNENEVILEKKSIKNQGFFEKFFNYFS
jgi:hypothetical protein